MCLPILVLICGGFEAALLLDSYTCVILSRQAGFILNSLSFIKG